MNAPKIRKYIQDQGINESIADTDDINLSAIIWLNSKDLAYMNPKELKILYESLIKKFRKYSVPFALKICIDF